jgi:septal ring factor EnvC (AmiA/AmiB activator)
MSRDVCGICWCPYDEDGRCACKPAKVIDPAELEATERQVEILSDALAESRKQKQALDIKINDLYERQVRDEALLRQALDALQYFDDYIQPLTDKFGGPKVAEPLSTTWHVHKAIAAIKERLP